MRAIPNGAPLSAADSTGLPVKPLLVEIYGPRVGATLLCGRQKTLPEDYFDGDLALCRRTFSFAVSDSQPGGCSPSRTRRSGSDG